MEAVRWSIKRGSPFGNESLVESTARRLDLTPLFSILYFPVINFPVTKHSFVFPPTMKHFILVTILSLAPLPLFAQGEIKFAAFRSDVTPPPGAPLCGGLVKAVEGVSEPLLALGVVILGADKPIVLCAVDWCEIRGTDYVRWCAELARAAGTTPDHVAVQCLHQHNAPIADSVAHELLAGRVRVIDVAWAERALAGVADSVEASLNGAEPLTHIAHGEAEVEQVASNRRVMGQNGKVIGVRTSATKDATLREAPEGTIDPMLKSVTFWNGGRKLAALHYYATHPMSYYGDGVVSSDFVGIARERRTRDDGVPHVYFTGCGGNITAGKYNDGNKQNRELFAERIHAAMVASEQAAKLAPLPSIEWRSRPVVLTANPDFSEEHLMKAVEDTATSSAVRIGAAMRVAFIRQSAARVPIHFTSLHFGDDVRLLHLPGEAFIEYQLFAQEQNPDTFIATASYGDGGPGYIPLERSFLEGGYEPTWAFAAPASENVMKQTIAELLKK